MTERIERDEEKKDTRERRRPTPIVAKSFADGTRVELVHDEAGGRTALCVFADGKWTLEPSMRSREGRLVPYGATNNLIAHEVVLFPSHPEPYTSTDALVSEVRDFIHRYVELPSAFLTIAAYYVLLSWVYDAFNELPYLRLRGDYGTGKTRFLLVVGSVCCRPIFASGASTVSPLFHALDSFGGTLVLDEADFRFSDEKAEIIKILNNGHARGLPVLRSEATREGEFNPRAFSVFGPKIVATRGHYDDAALESRFVTVDMGIGLGSGRVPVSLPNEYRAEALALRNKLLLYRFENVAKLSADESLAAAGLEPRLQQIFLPLASVMSTAEEREVLRRWLLDSQQELRMERGMRVEAEVLAAIQELARADGGTALRLKDVAVCYAKRQGGTVEHPVTSRWIGDIVRSRLRLPTRKRHGNFVVMIEDRAALERIYARYGLRESDDAIATA